MSGTSGNYGVPKAKDGAILKRNIRQPLLIYMVD
jgi:hypothetical protein